MSSATASGFGDPSADPGVRPDPHWRDHAEHWLQSARDGGFLAAGWAGGSWRLEGEEGASSPVEIGLRGYRWVGPRFPHKP